MDLTCWDSLFMECWTLTVCRDTCEILLILGSFAACPILSLPKPDSVLLDPFLQWNNFLNKSFCTFVFSYVAILLTKSSYQIAGNIIWREHPSSSDLILIVQANVSTGWFGIIFFECRIQAIPIMLVSVK